MGFAGGDGGGSMLVPYRKAKQYVVNKFISYLKIPKYFLAVLLMIPYLTSLGSPIFVGWGQ